MSKAQAFLAGNLINGLGLDKNLEKAEYWARKAVAQNSPTGMVILSQFYLAKDDYENVIHWLEQAKALGFPDPDGLLEMATLLHQSQTQTRQEGFNAGLLGLSSTASANQIKERSQRVDKNKLNDFQNYLYKKDDSLYKDKRALSSLVADMFTGNDRLINALKIAIDGNVAVDLAELKKQNSSLHETGIKRIFNNFDERYGLEKSRAIG
ncbi:MAG: hypothetical protein FWF81_08570 [Defluviitaleaceae bacterium]|nr:hypothetical protein [Defluviitaleaceae bacterium]